MKKLPVLSVLALLGATAPSFAREAATFEDAVRIASEGLIIRGTVLDSSTEGKDAPIPRIEPGTQPLLYKTWRIRIDECFYSAAGDCGDRVGTNIKLAAATGVAIERDGALAYVELITNSVTLAVTVPLSQPGSFLLFVRPNSPRAGSYRIVPLDNGCRALSTDRIGVELRRYDLLSEAAKARPEIEDLRRRRITNSNAPFYYEEVPLRDLSRLIQRIRGNVADAPQLDPQAPQR